MPSKAAKCRHTCIAHGDYTTVTQHEKSRSVHPHCTEECPKFIKLDTNLSPPIDRKVEISFVIRASRLNKDDQRCSDANVVLNFVDLQPEFLALAKQAAASTAGLVYYDPQEAKIDMPDWLYTKLGALWMLQKQYMKRGAKEVVISFRTWEDFMRNVKVNSGGFMADNWLRTADACLVCWPLPFYGSGQYKRAKASSMGPPLSKVGKQAFLGLSDDIDSRIRFNTDSSNFEFGEGLVFPGCDWNKEEHTLFLSLSVLLPQLHRKIYPSLEDFISSNNKIDILTRLVEDGVNPECMAPRPYKLQKKKRLLASEALVHKASTSSCKHDTSLPETEPASGESPILFVSPAPALESRGQLVVIFSQLYAPALADLEMAAYMVPEETGKLVPVLFVLKDSSNVDGCKEREEVSLLGKISKLGTSRPVWLSTGSQYAVLNEDKNRVELLAFVKKANASLAKLNLPFMKSGYRMDIGAVEVSGHWCYTVSEAQPLEGDASYFHPYLSNTSLINQVSQAIGREYIRYYLPD